MRAGAHLREPTASRQALVHALASALEDAQAMYEKPLSAQEPVVCIDEKPGELHREVRPPLAMQPGRVASYDAEYRRGGTAHVFCGVQPKAGPNFTEVNNDRPSPDFADYLLDLAAGYPEDNSSLYNRKAVVDVLASRPGEWLLNRFTTTPRSTAGGEPRGDCDLPVLAAGLG